MRRRSEEEEEEEGKAEEEETRISYNSFVILGSEMAPSSFTNVNLIKPAKNDVTTSTFLASWGFFFSYIWAFFCNLWQRSPHGSGNRKIENTKNCIWHKWFQRFLYFLKKASVSGPCFVTPVGGHLGYTS